jgi:threonine dehydrogenase-like Zn-dependent dehydrogenase
MKVMVYEGPRKVRLVEIENSELHDNEVRIQTMYTGISHGTEMNFYRGTAQLFKKGNNGKGIPYPIRSCDPGVWYMGYANVGKVVEVGAAVNEIKVGDIVYSNAPHQSQIIEPESAAIKIPQNVKPECAIFFTNLMTAYNGILDSRIKLGDTVVVSGLGVLGQ